MNNQTPVVGNPNRPKISLVGEKFYSLTVLSHSYKRIGKNNKIESFAECQCECGKIINTITQNVKRGRTKSCGCRVRSSKQTPGEVTFVQDPKPEKPPKHPRLSNLLNEVGNKFGILTILSQGRKPFGLTETIRSVVVCLCDCGARKEILLASLRNRTTTSCGCLKRSIKKVSPKIKTNKSHGLSYTSIYGRWNSMIQRCTNSKSINYKDYGGRGIKVCDSWLDVRNFYKDMGDPPDKHHLDRVDNDKGYSKENCRWVIPVKNMNNRRNSKYWFLCGIKYDSIKKASTALSVDYNQIRDWCNGYYSRTTGKFTPPRKDCYSELKY